jgi:hypothetical protein
VLAKMSGGKVGHVIPNESVFGNPAIPAIVGVVDTADLFWIRDALLADAALTKDDLEGGLRISPTGWKKIEKLKQAQVASRYAFFDRQFDNPDLDVAFKVFLGQAVAETGYKLRTVTQRAGLIDAIIEDEIRRCRFLIADLSDDNPGAYWEAGFAEGLGKPVIYISRAKDGKLMKHTHFDTNHRHTVAWDLDAPEDSAARLKAVIRNTLLGKQDRITNRPTRSGRLRHRNRQPISYE